MFYYLPFFFRGVSLGLISIYTCRVKGLPCFYYSNGEDEKMMGFSYFQNFRYVGIFCMVILFLSSLWLLISTVYYAIKVKTKVLSYFSNLFPEKKFAKLIPYISSSPKYAGLLLLLSLFSFTFFTISINSGTYGLSYYIMMVGLFLSGISHLLITMTGLNKKRN